MKKVITYGTYDQLHYGHIKLLERAKQLGDYLIVGVTSDDFDRSRGKINVQESLIERVEAVRQTGIADEIIVEEYEGQKIDDIKRLNIDIFTVGSDWKGYFDYIGDYCNVVYLDRTEGVSSSQIRAINNNIRIGIIGTSHIIDKYISESAYVNGLTLIKDCDIDTKNIDGVYVVSHPRNHFKDCKAAIEKNLHVLCESPLALKVSEVEDLYSLAKERGVRLVEGIKTAYSTAYSRMISLAKSGKIGQIISVDSTCTSMQVLDFTNDNIMERQWSSLTGWGPTALLPIFDLFGTHWKEARVISRITNQKYQFDDFSNASFIYTDSIASAKVGKGIKSEGQLIISGTKGYIYVPSPWWITDYFELRYEDQRQNKRYFYQLDGEGIRHELLSFIRIIEGTSINPISIDVSKAIASIMEHNAEKVSYYILK